jgi:hypothetical protein
MVSPGSQSSDISPCSGCGDKIRHTTAHRKQGNPQARGAQTPERHVFGVECDESVVVSVVGGHCFAIKGRGMEGIQVVSRVFIYNEDHWSWEARWWASVRGMN